MLELKLLLAVGDDFWLFDSLSRIFTCSASWLIFVCILQVLGWLEEKLPVEKNLPSTLVAVVAPLYSCLEDRSGDVRKKAQAVVPVMMQHVGWDAMVKQANKLKVRRIHGSIIIVNVSLKVNQLVKCDRAGGQGLEKIVSDNLICCSLPFKLFTAWHLISSVN